MRYVDMAKKPPNSKPIPNFGRINVDAGIADKLDHAGKIARALKNNKEFRQERTDGKRERQSNNSKARKKFGYKPKIRMSEDEFIHQIRNAERDLQRAEYPFADVKRGLLPSNHNKRDQGFNGWSSEFHREAHTGVVGKPTKRRDRSDPMHRVYPFAPKKR